MMTMTHHISRRNSSPNLLLLFSLGVVVALCLTPVLGVPAPGRLGGGYASVPRGKSLGDLPIVPFAPVGEPCDKLCTFQDSSPAKHYCCDMETGPGANPGRCPEKASMTPDDFLPPSPCTYDVDCTTSQKCCWDTYLQRKYCFKATT